MTRLLTQNSELRKHGIYNWSIPALVAHLSDGSKVVTCPHAGACAPLCYARNGTYLFPAVVRKHTRNLELVVRDPQAFMEQMVAECNAPRMVGKYVRIHDDGDFFADDYLLCWLDIARACPQVTFYAYTKEVSRFRRLVEGKAPANFLWVYSMGGKEDHLIDRERDRHAEVFPDEDSILAAGYTSQSDNDLICVLHPSNKIGIPANNIPHFRKRQGHLTFGELEAKRGNRAV
jgi:hypothetical protein